MATDTQGMGIPVPADSTRIQDFPKVARAGFERVAEVLAGGMTEGQAETIRREVGPAIEVALDEAGIFKGAVPNPDEEIALSFTDRDGRRFWIEADFYGRPTPLSLQILTEDLAPGMAAAAGAELGITPLADFYGWAWVVTDADNRALGGFRTDGTFEPLRMKYPPASIPAAALTAELRRGIEAGSTRPVSVPAGTGTVSTRPAAGRWQLRYDDPVTGRSTVLHTADSITDVTLGSDGAAVFFTAAADAGTAPAALYLQLPAGTARPVLPAAALASFGDSMTEGMGGGYGDYAFPAVTAAALGVPVYNGGISGQMSTEIAIRQGGIEPALTVAGGEIPASGPAAVTVTDPTASFRPGWEWSWQGSLAGVPGTLTKTTTGEWSFTRAAAGAATAAPAGSRFVSTPGTMHAGWIQTLWTGRNNAHAATILRDTAAMVARLTPMHKRYLVFSVCNTAAETSGTSGYNNVLSINNQLQTAYGERYLDVRRYLIAQGLTDAGITPTEQDRTDIAADVIPLSLRADSTHLNRAGYAVLGLYVASIIKQKGWI